MTKQSCNIFHILLRFSAALTLAASAMPLGSQAASIPSLDYRSVETFAGSGTAGSADATGTAATFNGPWGISADAFGNFYHADYTGKRIRRTTSAGVVSFIDSFSSFVPIATAIDPATGHLYVAIESHRILRYVNKNSGNYTTQAPVYGPEADLTDPVIVYAGNFTGSSGSTNGNGTSARFNAPHGLCVRGGILYVADKGNNLIRKVNLSNAAVTTVTVTGGTLSAPEGVWVAEDGTIYVACTGSDLIQKIAPDGVLSTVAGSAAGNADGIGTAASFNDPRGLAMNGRGELFVADSANHAIRRISPSGTVRTIAGNGTSGFSDGVGAAARFNSPRGIVFGSDGLLYITDHANHRIRLMNATGPLITGAPTSLAAFTANSGNPSAVQSFAFAGTLLEGPITVTAPSGFEVSTDGSNYAASVTSNESATLSIRIAATAATGSLAGNLTLASAQADTISIALSGTVTAYITPSTASLGGFTAQSGSASTVQTLTVAGTGFTAPLTVTAPAGFEVSTDNSTFSSSLSIPPSGSNIPSTILYARLTSTAPLGAAAGNLTLTSTSMSTQTVALSGTVTPTTGSLGGFTAQSGSASTVQTFTVAGSGFTAPLTVTAPAGFEVSTDNSTFSSSLSLSLSTKTGIIESVYGGNFNIASGAIWRKGNGREFPNPKAFAAITINGSVLTWGSANSGGDSSAVAASLSSNVTAVYSNGYAFAALKDNGAVVTWGQHYSGGDSSAVASSLTSNVTAVYSTKGAFAALKSNGSVITWGTADFGGNSSAVAASLSSDVTAVYSTEFSFAALKSNGSVVTWGNANSGGNSSAVAASLSSGVTAAYSNRNAFAALKSDGSVVTWGNADFGGNSSAVASSLTSNVTAVYSNGYYAFAALKDNGAVVTWGSASWGGDSSAVAASLTSNVTAVYSNGYAFAALKSNGSVVTWGSANDGSDSSAVAASLSSNVTAVYSNEYAFAALKSNGSLVTWGDAYTGGDSTAVAASLTSNVTAVFSTQTAFAVVKTDGSVVTWGDADNGGTGGPANIGANPISSTLYTRLASTAPNGAVSGNLTITSSGVTTQIVALSGTVASASSLATLATTPVSNSIRTTTATLGGEVTADGGAAITARGVVYSLTATDSDPQVGGIGVTNLPATGTTGVFSVNATALTPGAAYTFKAYATNSAGTSYSAAGTFTALRPVEGWRLSNFGDVANSGNGANAASPAGDSIPNLVKYALCLDPAQWGGLPQPEIANDRLKINFQRDPARSDVTITVEGTSDLVNAPWVPVAISTTGGAFSGNGSILETPLQGGLQQVEVSDSVDTLTEPRRRFLRIRATLPAE